MVLPISIVAINFLGLRVKIEIIPEDLDLCFLSNSILSLLDEIKAISIPEKNAEKIKQIITMM